MQCYVGQVKQDWATINDPLCSLCTAATVSTRTALSHQHTGDNLNM
jgi:hypothetical protein